jgi:hypothetical protein
MAGRFTRTLGSSSMNDLIDKLAKDMRWRLSRAGAEHKPPRKERDGWGVFRFPPLASLLIWLALLPVVVGAADTVSIPELGTVFGLLGISILTLLVTVGVDQFNKAQILRTYRRLLNRNERFTLVEYAKFLKRQIKRAQSDQALGGPAEVARLQKVYRQLNELLQKGAGNELFPVESHLSKEADLAEAVVETYTLPERDELAELDDKLPPGIRERLAELELEAEPIPVRKRQLE